MVYMKTEQWKKTIHFENEELRIMYSLSKLLVSKY